MEKKNDLINIEKESLEDILARKTGNSLADEEIPEMLRTAIKNGAIVLITESGNVAYKLSLSKNGQFEYISLT